MIYVAIWAGGSVLLGLGIGQLGLTPIGSFLFGIAGGVVWTQFMKVVADAD